MDTRSSDRANESPMGETPEDVAVLYSWANLHGAKYRDFSASRREYRAQLRHHDAEQAREQKLRAQADAEAAASIAEGTARQAEQAAHLSPARDTDQSQQQGKRDAEEAARVVNAERIEAARRAEAAAFAEAFARREEREIAEAGVSARKQAAHYVASELHRRQNATEDPDADLPGQISDPYTPQPPPAQLRVVSPSSPARSSEPVHIVTKAPRSAPDAHPRTHEPRSQAPAPSLHPDPLSQPSPVLPSLPARSFAQAAPDLWEESPPLPMVVAPARRPRGYRPDDASGVRQIYRGPEFEPSLHGDPLRQLTPVRSRTHSEVHVHDREDCPQPPTYLAPPVIPAVPHPSAQAAVPPPADPARSWTSTSQTEPSAAPTSTRQVLGAETPAPEPSQQQAQRRPSPQPATPAPAPPPQYIPGRIPSTRVEASAYSPSAEAPGSLEDPGQRRRRQDYFPDQPGTVHPSTPTRPGISATPAALTFTQRQPAPPDLPAIPPEPAAPAWLCTIQNAHLPYRPNQSPEPPVAPQPSIADTLQQSRERVASRWFALKGVFEQPGQESADPKPVRQKETRTPVLAVFSLAGGVGKTSLVATLGRSLSSLGEKVLLTDTTSHGLLPFYFGASELRQGTVRTFSPPSGSTDAPIYLVSYDIDDKCAEEAEQEALVDEITNASRGTHRVLLDLTVNSGWVARRMARHKPTVLIPVAPDMNSVISLQGVEKFFNGITDSDSKPLQIFYLLNQFDASLPLHLDVREVLRRQLGDRLLPTVIRRAPAVSEALAEGMTIIDYFPEAPVAEDYLSIAIWLRTLAAPATTGFRNVRWSER